MSILNNFENEISYYLYTFLMCWYPCFILVSSLRILFVIIFCDKKYNIYNTIYSVLFTTYIGTKYHSFTTKYDVYSFRIVNGHLKRYYETEDKEHRRNIKIFVVIMYISLILVIGTVGTIRNNYNMIYIYRALFYVNLMYIIGLSSLFIWIKPMELYAKRLVINGINSGEL